MIYVISDIHGCYDKYKEMLEKIHLSGEDKLYVLGDCADRGERGIDVWLDLMRHTNVIPIIGNHDDMALKFMRVWRNPELITESFEEDISLWIYNGGRPTLESFQRQNEFIQDELIRYIESFSLFEEVNINGKDYFLAHSIGEQAGLELNNYSRIDYIWGRPNYNKCYDSKRIVVTGHTPTGFVNKKYEGSIYKKNNHIAIDCGAVYSGGRLGCICLDTMEEFYV